MIGLSPCWFCLFTILTLLVRLYVEYLWHLLLYWVPRIDRGLTNTTIFSSILENFIIPFLVAFAIAGISAYWLSEIKGNLMFVFLFLCSLVIGWFAAFLSCKDLREIVLKKWIWKT